MGGPWPPWLCHCMVILFSDSHKLSEHLSYIFDYHVNFSFSIKQVPGCLIQVTLGAVFNSMVGQYGLPIGCLYLQNFLDSEMELYFI